MANNKEEAGKGTPRPGEMPGARRPYATIDLTASEVEGGAKDKARPAASSATSTASEPGAEAKSSSASPKDATKGGGGRTADSLGASMLAEASATLAGRMRSAPLLSHLAAGAAGALIVLFAAQLFTHASAPPQELGNLTRRVVDLENALGTRPGAGLRARIEELTRSTGALGETQAKLARETKSLETKISGGQEVPAELTARIAKLEETLAAASAADPAAVSPQVTALTAKLGEIEKASRQAAETARSGFGRFDGELSALRTEAGRLTQRLDTLKGEVEERLRGAAMAADLAPVTAKLAALERDAHSFAKSEADRVASAAHMLLALELASLKRAIDRGESFSDELARAKKVAGASLNLAPLERHMREGVPTTQELVQSFRKTANAMLDSEAEPADASLLDRLMSGARSIVRVRKSGHAADDVSLEAVIGRMEGALKEGRLAEVLAQAKKLPPKAALAGEDWIRKVEARQAVEQAIAEVEAQLRSSLGGGAAESKR